MSTARAENHHAQDASTSGPRSAGPNLDFDEQAFVTTFNIAPMWVAHNLVDHPLFQLDRLAELADFLPTKQVEHNFGDIPDVIPQDQLRRLDAKPSEIVKGIAENKCWVGLRQVESDPEYRALLETTLAEVTGLIDEGKVTKMEGFIFISAPNATTPVHLDPEHNLLLQIQGSKDMVIGRFDTPALAQRAVEDFHGALKLHQERKPAHMETFVLTPGKGVYVPIHAPHVVNNGPEPSISFSITWNTLRTDKDAAVHKVNHRLRKLGLTPSAPGAHAGRDFVKQAVWRTPRGVKRAIRKLR